MTINEFSSCPGWLPRRLAAVAVALASALTIPCLKAQPAPGTFTISLAPSQRTIVQGGYQDTSVQIGRGPGFTGAVALSLQGAPAGVTATFDPNPVLFRSSRLTLQVGAHVPPGTYTMFVQGTSGASLQATLLLTVAGPLPAPFVSVDPTVRPDFPSLSGPDPAHPRVVAALADAAHKTNFVQDELIVATNDASRFNAFLSRWHGTITSTLNSTAVHLPRAIYVVHIDPSFVDVTKLPANLQKANPNGTGTVRFSDLEGMRLLAVAAEESAGGLAAGLNFIAQTTATFLGGISNEAPTGQLNLDATSYDPNAFNWDFMKQWGNPGLGVTHAWQALEFAGKLGVTTTVAIIEPGGFAPNTDFPSFTPLSLIAGQNALFVSGSNKAPWHGTSVAQALAGIANNNFGAAGTAGAGPNAKLLLISAHNDVGSLLGGLLAAETLNAKIINISSEGTVPFIVAPLTLGALNDVTRAMHDIGILIFASAGNDGEDIDGQDCLGVCWEATWYWPCENDGVICVGGLAPGTRDRHPDSNYGSGHTGDLDTVDIWAPYMVRVGPDPGEGNMNKWVEGTSFSSPYVAGVAAMVWAANPALTAGQVEEILYSTAGVSYDPTVNEDRVVLADLAVMAALGNLPPKVTITAPVNNSGVSVGGFNAVKFSATAVDFEDGPKCCKLTWTSSVDGVIGSGATFSYVFLTPGIRTITVTATDMSGGQGSASIKITASIDPPFMTILNPAQGTILYKNVVTVFNGKGVDNLAPTLPCSSLTWSSNKPGDQQIAGTCNAKFTFTSLGPRTITLTGKNPQNVLGSTTVDVNVVDPPPGLHVTILSPANGASYYPKESSPLEFTFSGAQGQFSSYQWRIMVNGKETPIKVYPGICLGCPPTWIPSDYGFLTGTLGVYVTDGIGQTGSDHVTVSVDYPPK